MKEYLDPVIERRDNLCLERSKQWLSLGMEKMQRKIKEVLSRVECFVLVLIIIIQLYTYIKLQ
jgi:hypothetical protein